MSGKDSSPIIRALADAEKKTTGEIRVHLSRYFLEPKPMTRARNLFEAFGMGKSPQRNGVLLYFNIRKRKFAIVADQGLHEKVGQPYWDELAKELRNDLRSTHPENAIAITVRTIGETMKRFFPAR